MARFHGRGARLYVNITSGGTAAPLLHTATFDINLATDRQDVTAFGDSTKQWVAGLADGQGNYSGFWSDTASTTLITAALDGVARKFYFYPTSSDSIYLSGTAFFDTQLAVDVNGPGTISGTFSLATTLLTTGL
jgi:hypothetical protein